MKKLSNPFILYGYVSPEYFCDRMEETEKLISALKNGRNVTLMSPRRIGKTGLIHNAFHYIREQQEEAVCCYIDIFSTTSMRDLVKFLGEEVFTQLRTFQDKAVETFSNILSHCRVSYTSDELLGGKVSLEFRKEDAYITLREIFSYLVKSEKECYIAIDEFQQIAEYEEGNVEALLRTYVQQCPNVHFIFAGSKAHMMSEMFDSPKHPFYRSTEKMHLYELPENVYYEFASTKLKSVMTILPEEIFHKIYTIFHGHTWYIQYILNKLYETQPAVVEEEDIQQCLNDIINSNSDDYQKQYRMLTENQQQLLMAIASEGNVSSINGSEFINRYSLKGTSSINKALKFLINNEYVYSYPEGYQVYDRFLALWLRRR